MWHVQNAYDIAMLINPVTLANGAERSGQTCGTINCSIPDIQAFCQPPNVLTTDNGTIEAKYVR